MIFSPTAIRSSANSSRACWRHWPKVMPVSLRNLRWMVLASRLNRALQSDNVEPSPGSRCNALQIRLIRWSAGCGRFNGKVGRIVSSSRISRSTRASRESGLQAKSKSTETLINSLSNAETLTARVSAGRSGLASGCTKTLRILIAPTQRIECTSPLGIQMPRLGGTVHWLVAACTTITPSMA
ncbi:hypothetical protein D9M69_532170 [compost metagenome]